MVKDQTSLPVSSSKARSLPSSRVAMKIKPPAVTTGPLRGIMMPPPCTPCAVDAGESPTGICHLMVPSFKS